MGRKTPPSFDFFPDDFVAGTIDMHPLARGIYISLLCHQWSHGSIPRPDEIRRLSQITGAMPDELADHLDEVLRKFVEQEDGTFLNERLAAEYAKKENRYKRASDNANKRWRSEADADAHADAYPPACADDDAEEMLFKEAGRRKKEDQKKKNVEPFCAADLDLPFESYDFRTAWQAFCKMRTEIRKPQKPTGAKAALRQLEKMGESRAIAALEHTTANEWQGIREPDRVALTSGVGGGRATFAQQRIQNTKSAAEAFATDDRIR